MIFFLAQLYIGLLFCFSTPAFGQNTPFKYPAFKTTEHSNLLSACSTNRSHCRTSVRHIDRAGIGYAKGYTTLEGFFAPNPESVTIMPFLDLPEHLFNDRKIPTNHSIPNTFKNWSIKNSGDLLQKMVKLLLYDHVMNARHAHLNNQLPKEEL